MKKGQVTIFVIISIIVVFGIVLFFVLNDNARELFKNVISSQAQYPEQVESIRVSIEDCVDDSLERVIEVNSLQGGYYFAPENSIYYDNEDLSLARYVPLYINGGFSVPSMNDLKDEIREGLFSEISSCIDSEQFIDRPINVGNAQVDIDPERYDLSVEILDGEVIADVVYPVIINFDGSVYEISEYESNLQSNYLKEFELAKEITRVQADYGKEICLTCNSDLADKYDAQLFNQEYFEDENTYVVIYNILMDDPLNEDVEIFSFAHRLEI